MSRHRKVWAAALLAIAAALLLLAGGSYAWALRLAGREQAALDAEAQRAADAVARLYRWGYTVQVVSDCPNPQESQRVSLTVPAGKALTADAISGAWLPGCDLYTQVGDAAAEPPAEPAAEKAALAQAPGAEIALTRLAGGAPQFAGVEVTLSERAPGLLGLLGRRLTSTADAISQAPSGLVARAQQELDDATARAVAAREKPARPTVPPRQTRPQEPVQPNQPPGGPSLTVNCAGIASLFAGGELEPDCQAQKK